MQRSMSSRFLWSDDRRHRHHHHHHRAHAHNPFSIIDIENPPELLPAVAAAARRRRQWHHRIAIPFSLPTNLLSTLRSRAAQCTSMRHLLILLLLCVIIYSLSSTLTSALFALAVLFLIFILIKTASRTNLLINPSRRTIFLDLEEQLIARRSIVGNLGVEVHQDGTRYAGEYRDGVLSRGRVVKPGEYSYGGDWGSGRSSQAYGVEKTPGGVYMGQFLRRKRDGYGRVERFNGEEYVGEWRNGRRQGVGREKFSDGSSYEGEFWQDKKHGVGAYYHRNGNIYQGEYFQDMATGLGVYRSVLPGDTYTYEGSWHDDRIQGHGVYLQNNNPVPISGNWVRGFIKNEEDYIPVSDPRIKNAVQGARKAAQKCEQLGLREVESRVFKAIAEANNAERAARIASTNAHYIIRLHPLHPRRLTVTASAELVKALRALGNSGRDAAQTLARLMADWFG